MKKDKQPLVLLKADYELLMEYLRGANSQIVSNRPEAEDLQAELKKALVVDQDSFPPDVVRINSKVKVAQNQKVMELTLVPPDQANSKERKVSVIAPIGAALIGFRKGQQVQWRVPTGLKTFTIEDVVN